MPFFDRDGVSFHYLDKGSGLPFVFQHGLGGDLTQPFGLYTPPEGVRLIGFDFRAHGQTRPVGDVHAVAIAPFADDLVALLDHLRIPGAVVGGVSLGAAVALNAALRRPSRVLGLVLSHPAWLDRPLPENARPFTHVAQHLLKYGAKNGLSRFRLTPEYGAILAESPETARSLENQFLDARAEECVVRLERIPHDCPCHDRAELATILAPALVLGARHDPIHPWEFAATLAGLIKGSELVELTPPSVSLETHVDEFQRAVDGFLSGINGRNASS